MAARPGRCCGDPEGLARGTLKGQSRRTRCEARRRGQEGDCDAAEGPALREARFCTGVGLSRQTKWPRVGPFRRLTSRLAVVVVHNDNAVVVRMPVMMPAVAVLHDNGFSACHRRRRHGDRSKRGNDTSKLLHRALLLIERRANVRSVATFPLRRAENSERLFSLRCAWANKPKRLRAKLIGSREANAAPPH